MLRVCIWQRMIGYSKCSRLTALQQSIAAQNNATKNTSSNKIRFSAFSQHTLLSYPMEHACWWTCMQQAACPTVLMNSMPHCTGLFISHHQVAIPVHKALPVQAIRVVLQPPARLKIHLEHTPCLLEGTLQTLNHKVAHGAQPTGTHDAQCTEVWKVCNRVQCCWRPFVCVCGGGGVDCMRLCMRAHVCVDMR